MRTKFDQLYANTFSSYSFQQKKKKFYALRQHFSMEIYYIVEDLSYLLTCHFPHSDLEFETFPSWFVFVFYRLLKLRNMLVEIDYHCWCLINVRNLAHPQFGNRTLSKTKQSEKMFRKKLEIGKSSNVFFFFQSSATNSCILRSILKTKKKKKNQLFSVRPT